MSPETMKNATPQRQEWRQELYFISSRIILYILCSGLLLTTLVLLSLLTFIFVGALNPISIFLSQLFHFISSMIIWNFIHAP